MNTNHFWFPTTQKWRPRWTSIVNVAAIALCGLVWACDGGTTEPTRTEDSGNLTVSVEDDGGTAVVGARVEVHVGDAIEEVGTGENGDAVFPDLPFGSYPIQIELPSGYESLPDQPSSVTVDQAQTQLSVQVLALESDTITLSAGVPDTVALAGGVRVIATASSQADGAKFAVEHADSDVFGDPEIMSPISLAVGAPNATENLHGKSVSYNGIGSGPAVSAAAEAPIEVVVRTEISGEPDEGILAMNAGSVAEPILLYADAVRTTAVLPDGSSRTALESEFELNGAEPFSTYVAMAGRDTSCEDASYLRARGNESDAGKRPLILIHGWQPFDGTCDEVRRFDPESNETTWGELLGRLEEASTITNNYNIYVARYPTFERVDLAVEFLDGALEELNNGAVIVGHSMGGLVARGLLALQMEQGEEEKIHSVVSLGTPHNGSPLANALDFVESAYVNTNLAFVNIPGVIWNPFPVSDGSRDLRPESELIHRLNQSPSSRSQVYSIAGQYAPGGFEGNLLFKSGAALLEGVYGIESSDGMVPRASALPDWSVHRRTLTEHHHGALTNGSSVWGELKNILSSIALDCGVPPERLDNNDFMMSGSIARQPGTRNVDITINPIVVNNQTVTGLEAEDFAVVENGCLRDFSLTREEGGVGVDIAFIQDLSTSMDAELSGVKQSVSGFAENLAARGLDVQFAAVGFTGHESTIPSTPGNSPAEYIGPVQDFTDADQLVDHVRGWSTASSGNVDFAENGLEAIEWAHENLSWRDGATRAYVLISDAHQHVAGQDCNGDGECSDQTIESIVQLLEGNASVYAISSEDPGGVGADPRNLAQAAGGQWLPLPGSGSFDLNATDLAATLGETIRLSFTSAAQGAAFYELRVRASVNVNGELHEAELAPPIVLYSEIPTLHQSLQR